MLQAARLKAGHRLEGAAMKRLKNFVMAIAFVLAVPTQSVVAQSPPTGELQPLVQRYAEAWASRDAGRIVALHSADSTFRLFIDGAAPAKGQEAIRQQFQKILTDNPTYRSTVRSLSLGSDNVVIEYDIHMDPPRAFTFGASRYVPNGRAYLLPAIDVIYFRDGLVTAKHTYLDATVIRHNSRSASRVRQ
jgi:ketosteroid isomerase-like protein